MAGHVILAGGSDSIRTDDANHLDLTGDHEVILCVALDDWSPAAINCLYAKWQADSAAGLAYAFRIHSASSGIVNPVWWDTGTNAKRELFGSATGRTDGEHLWIRVAFDVSTGSGLSCLVQTSTDPVLTAVGSISWSTLNTLTNGTAAAISSNSQPLWLGLRSTTNDPMLGKYYYFELKNGIGGTTVARMDARTADPSGSDGFGNSWTFAGNAAWVATDTTVEAATIATTVAVPQPTITVPATATPATIASTVAVPTAAPAGAAKATPPAVAVVVAVPQAGVAADQAATPATVAASVVLPQPAVAAGSTVAASVVGVVVGVPAATAVVADNQVVTPQTIGVVAAVPVVAVARGATVSAAVIAVTTSIPKALARAGALLIAARELGQFQRINQRLHLARVRRSLRRGFQTGEGWERVSDVFVFDDDDASDGSFDQAMAAVVQAWADHQGDDEATLTTAINTALDAFGFRRPDGTRLI